MTSAVVADLCEVVRWRVWEAWCLARAARTDREVGEVLDIAGEHIAAIEEHLHAYRDSYETWELEEFSGALDGLGSEIKAMLDHLAALPWRG